MLFSSCWGDGFAGGPTSLIHDNILLQRVKLGPSRRGAFLSLYVIFLFSFSTFQYHLNFSTSMNTSLYVIFLFSFSTFSETLQFQYQHEYHGFFVANNNLLRGPHTVNPCLSELHEYHPVKYFHTGRGR